MNWVSASCMATSIAINMSAGHNNRALMAGASFGLIGTLAGVAEEISGLQMKSLAGAGLTVTGLGFIMASEHLTQRFEHSNSPVLKQVLGQPRKWGGRMLMAAGGLMALDKHNAGLDREAFYYLMLSAGDYPVSLSKPQKTGSEPTPLTL